MNLSSLAPVGAGAPIAIVILKASLLLSLGWSATRLMHNASATARHIVWLTVLLGVLLVPAIDRFMAVRVAVLPAPMSMPTVALPGVQGRPEAPTPVPAAIVSAMTPQVVSQTPAPRAVGTTFYIFKVLLGLWATIALALLVRLMCELVTVNALLRRARGLEAGDWPVALAEASARVPVREAPRLLMSDEVEMAFACGVVSPAIVMPTGAAEWPADRRRAVLLHELAHLRRRDLIGQHVAAVACAMHWFNPLVWIAARSLRSESERASDEVVLGTGVRPSEYAQHLLDMVTSFRRHAPAAAVAMARPKDFEGRLVAILDPDAQRSRLGRSRPYGVALVALLGLAIGAGSPVRRAPAALALNESRPVPRIEVAHDDSVPSGALAPASHAGKTVHDVIAPASIAADSPTRRLSSASIASLRRYGTGGIVNPLMMLLREADSIGLSGWQADSVATLNRRYMVRLSSIWSPIAAYYATHDDSSIDSSIIGDLARAPRLTRAALLEVVPEVDALLSPEQRRRVSPITSAYLDVPNVAAMGGNSLSGPDDVFISVDLLYAQRGRGRGGG